MAKRTIRRLLLIRCGPTEWDRSGRLQGQTDLPMLPDAAAGVSERLSGLTIEGLTTILTGPDEACIATGSMLAERSGLRAQPIDELREIDLGLWAGLRVDELEERFERAGRQWLDDPASVAAPEGETFSGMAERVLPAIQRVTLKKRSSVGVALIVRPIVHAFLRCRLEGLETSEMWKVCTETQQPAWFELEPNDARLSLEVAIADRKAPAA